jgi:hypothetical protein
VDHQLFSQHPITESVNQFVALLMKRKLIQTKMPVMSDSFKKFISLLRFVVREAF